MARHSRSKTGRYPGDIGHAVQRHAEQAGYSIVREYCGHGIGRDMHEEPAVLHYGQPGSGLVLQEGMVFTIEPMINQGDRRIKQKKDGWTVVTRDKNCRRSGSTPWRSPPTAWRS